MNFSPFPGQAAAPQHFTAKFGYEAAGTVLQETRYQQGASGVQFVPSSGDLQSVKFRQGESVVVVSSATQGPVTLAQIPIQTVNTGVKYHTITSTGQISNIAYGQFEPTQLKIEQRIDKREYREEIPQELMATHHQVTQTTQLQQGGQQLLVVLHEPKEAAALARAIKQEARNERGAVAPAEFIIYSPTGVGDLTDTSTWQTLGSGVADYLSALPLPLHHLLKYSTSEGKRDDQPTVVTVATNTMPQQSAAHTQIQPSNIVATSNNNNNVGVVVQSVQTSTIVSPPAPPPVVNNVSTVIVNKGKKKKKKFMKEKKPRPKPGEIRLTTALDGSTLYCCPECHMAYPERGLLEQHLVGHTMERRFICDICNAALKRKDHLTRHKQSHNPDRPHVCSVCLKAFKRKEQLTLHFVIHSGEKRHICTECGKGFYRKDHLRKHTRSHIARRVKAELSQQNAGRSDGIESRPVPAPAPS
ncbi:transcription factor Sp3 [Plutella xylostella]|uniref:transcription factor Sp3 n=1 Tax=Plutella xylostella TaxID=51655 RepID=UPI0020327532|nr:transcription factor Sp3 [Plutella xylostella]XP_048482767.1 transcription factor Sp3 [Plutella xylostella]